MRFLFAWQHVEPSSRLTGLDGLRTIVAQLDGYELAARAWERDVLPARMDRYEPSMLDMLCLTGEVGWGRLIAPLATGSVTGADAISAAAGPRSARALVGATPVALFLRDHGDLWHALRGGEAPAGTDGSSVGLSACGAAAQSVYETLRARGASFLRELTRCAPDAAGLFAAVGELVASGLVTSDGFAGLRAIVRATAGRVPPRSAAAQAGRWSLLRPGDTAVSREAAVEAQAWALLRRYGVVFRRVLTRESNAAPWRDLARVLRRLEMRGEIRGGRFVSGMSGEQFALPDAVERLRETRRTPADGRLIVISAADPLNLAGIVTAGERIRAVASVRVAYRDGVPADEPGADARRMSRLSGAWVARAAQHRGAQDDAGQRHG
jgi:ATP-dependent Lhr-like helicase